MDELQADLVKQDVRRLRFRYRLAAGVVFGTPLLAAMITASALSILQTMRIDRDDEVLLAIVVGNAVLAAIGSGVGSWIEPGQGPKSKIAGLFSGCAFGFLFYLALSVAAQYLVNRFGR